MIGTRRKIFVPFMVTMDPPIQNSIVCGQLFKGGGQGYQLAMPSSGHNSYISGLFGKSICWSRYV